MKVAFITLSREGARLVEILIAKYPGAGVFIHEKAPLSAGARSFSSVMELTAEIFGSYDGLVYIAPAGAVVRAIAPKLSGKKSDPAVVQVDIGGRYAVSLLSGHEGGANSLAVAVANAIGAEPVISTSTEAVKNIIVGVGCRKGMDAAPIVEAVYKALEEAKASLEKVRFMASADVKENEPGLAEAARRLGVPLRFIKSDEIRNCGREFAHSAFVMEKVGVPAVAEPSALLAGRRTVLILGKRKYGGITVAVAKESFLSLE